MWLVENHLDTALLGYPEARMIWKNKLKFRWQIRYLQGFKEPPHKVHINYQGNTTLIKQSKWTLSVMR